MIYRSGTYELREDNTVEDGTKIVIQLKEDCKNFSDEEEIKGAHNKYSFFFFFKFMLLILNSDYVRCNQAI